jgi:microcystin-dependent protein
MAVNPSPFGPKPQFVTSSGLPASGYKLFSYGVGSTTKQNTFTDSTGNTANANPIVLNTLGQPATEIWFTAGTNYKLVLAPSTDTDPPASPVWSVDNLKGINDATVTLDQWISSGVTPTYSSTTQFTVPGDQTSTFTVNRRVKCTETAGTVYGYITGSAYTALTTVTVSLDSGTLDSGLSEVQLGLLSSVNPAVPKITNAMIVTSLVSDQTAATIAPNDYLMIADTSASNVSKKGLASDILLPPGTIIDFGGSAAPTGYLACNGAAVSRTTYAALFTAISTLWGAGDGSTTFNVPNFADGEASVQSAGTVGAATNGVVINHTHTVPIQNSSSAGGAVIFTGNAATTGDITTSNPSGGGSKNLAAGRRVYKCIKT